MGFSDFWLQFNNGKKKQLNDVGHGVRKEQLDPKFAPLFEFFDRNGDGTLEVGELDGISDIFKSISGGDKVLDTNENIKANSIFSSQFGTDTDYQEFFKAISDASLEIENSTETQTNDGGKIITTRYKDGTVQTIAYYADGDFKYKETIEDKYEAPKKIIVYNKKEYSEKEFDNLVKKKYKQHKKSNISSTSDSSRVAATDFNTFKRKFMSDNDAFELNKKGDHVHNERFELSDRAKQDLACREFMTDHFVDTHFVTKEALESMGILDKAGAAFNVSPLGHRWTDFTNLLSKWLGDGTPEDYDRYFSLVKKFQPSYDRALRVDGIRTYGNPISYFGTFDNFFPKYDMNEATVFHDITERYQMATCLRENINLLNSAISEIEAYEREQNEVTYSPVKAEGLNPGSHIQRAFKILVQYCQGNEELANMLLDGVIGNNSATIQRIKEIKEQVEEQLNSVLQKPVEQDGEIGYTPLKYEELKQLYYDKYKEIFQTDIVPDELTNSIMNAKMTAGTIRIALITIASIIISRSPFVAEITASAA